MGEDLFFWIQYGSGNLHPNPFLHPVIAYEWTRFDQDNSKTPVSAKIITLTVFFIQKKKKKKKVNEIGIYEFACLEEE